MSWINAFAKKTRVCSRQVNVSLGSVTHKQLKSNSIYLNNGLLPISTSTTTSQNNNNVYSNQQRLLSTGKKFTVIKKSTGPQVPAEPVVVKTSTPESAKPKVEKPKVEKPVEKVSLARQKIAEAEAKAPKPKPKGPGFFKSIINATKTRTFRKRVLIGTVTLAALFAYAAWYKRKLAADEAAKMDAMDDVIAPPPDQFQHPLNNSGVVYTVFFYIRRLFQLFKAFTPLIIKSIKIYFSGGMQDPSNRAEWLDVMVQCIEAAGCTFLKFGQWLSMRPDIFPLDVINVLAKLRDNAPSHSYEETKRLIEASYGVPITEIFEEFPEEAIASGSIAQVYKCRLTEEWAQKANMRDTNNQLIRDVAVKVRHPEVMNQTWIDVDLLYAVVDLIPNLCIPFSREEFRKMLQNQIDFRWEAHYLSRFAYNFREEIHQKYMDFPRVSGELLTVPVLIESWAEGASVASIFTEVGDMFKPLNDAASLSDKHIAKTNTGLMQFIGKRLSFAGKFIRDEFEEMVYYVLKSTGINIDQWYTREHIRVGEDKYVYNPELSEEENNIRAKKKVLAFTLFDMYLKMFLRDNLIHGDLHAGNVLFNLDNHRATVLDAGMTVSLEGDIMSNFGFFLKAICEGDPDSLIKCIEAFEVSLPSYKTISGDGVLKHNPAVKKQFTENIYEIFERFYQKSVYGNEIPEQVSIGDVVGQVLLALEKEKVQIRGDVASAILSMSVIEGILRQLDPDLDIILKSVVYFVKYKEVTDFGSIIKS